MANPRYNNAVTRIILKTIVSSPDELAFVQLNLIELYELVDTFLICEANFTHTGENRDFELEAEVQNRFIDVFPKVKYIRIYKCSQVEASDQNPEKLHKNEQLIRNGFTSHFPIYPNDIVISVDADEVLFKKRVKLFLRKLNRKIYPAESYNLRLHQMIYRIGYNWIDCNFQGPTISRASHFLIQQEPQWRYSGRRTFRKSGTHFSWIMSIDSMINKINKYAHKDLHASLANYDLLSNAVQNKIYIFDINRNFRIREIKNLRSRKFPRSLRSNTYLFDKSLFVKGLS